MIWQQVPAGQCNVDYSGCCNQCMAINPRVIPIGRQADGHIKGNCHCQSVRVWDVSNGLRNIELLSQLQSLLWLVLLARISLHGNE